MASKPNKNVVQPEDQKKKAKDRGFKTASDGRLIIDGDSSDSDDGAKKKSSNFNTASDSESDNDVIMSAAETEILRDRKRKRTDASSIASGIVKSKYMPGGSGIHRRVGSSAGSVYNRSEYKSKKAAGDVKKKDKHDPYTYLPLQRSGLNKRKKTKRLGQFKNIVGAAKSGAKKGMKAKRNKK